MQRNIFKMKYNPRWEMVGKLTKASSQVEGELTVM